MLFANIYGEIASKLLELVVESIKQITDILSQLNGRLNAVAFVVVNGELKVRI
jgi:hypothetical protein